MSIRYVFFVVVVIVVRGFLGELMAQEPAGRWSEQAAKDWYSKQPWLVGSNYIPKDAINELEMWQPETFNPAQIDRELGWAEGIGMNTMRVFLHDLLWEQDPSGFKKRIDRFLTIATKHQIRPIFVLFDSCWDPAPRLGPQHPPIPGVHNSGWVQSPGAAALTEKSQYLRLEAYVKGVVGAFANDPRVMAWDVWNEPGNDNDNSYGPTEPKNKAALVEALLPKVFAWARSARPVQPLTSGVWDVRFRTDALTPLQSIQLDNSDIITFHNYGWPEEFEREIRWLREFNRPIICTEFMARSAGSTFDTILPIANKEHVGAINWGFVSGKTQTNLPWDSWQRPYVLVKPPVWFHEVLRQDGTPYRQAEVDLIRRLSGRQ